MKYLYAAIVVVGLVYFYQVAQGYTKTGYLLPSKTVTYSCGSPELQQAVQMWANVSGLSDGGCSENPAITLTIVANVLIPPPVGGMGGNGHIWVPVRNAHHLGVITHETGHAIGLGHSTDPNANMAPYCCNPLNSDDIAGVVALYGPEPPSAIIRRGYLPGVSRE